MNTITAPSTFDAPVAADSPVESSTRTSLWKPAVISGLVAAAATTAVAAVARAADVPLDVDGEAIPLAAFAELTFIGALLGLALAAVLRRRARHPHRTFVVTTTVLTIASLVPDLSINADNWSRFVLALTHVVAAAIVIPTIARRLAD